MAEELGIPKNALAQMRAYFGEVHAEMKKVTWPGKQEIYGTTLMVIITTFAFAFYFGVCDWLFRFGVQRALDFFLHRG